MILAYGLLLGVSWSMGALAIPALIGLGATLAAVVAGMSFIAKPLPERAKRLDLMAGLWVLICYAAAGFAPFLTGGGS